LKRTGGAPNGEPDRAKLWEKPQGKAAGVVSLGLQFACSNANVLNVDIFTLCWRSLYKCLVQTRSAKP